MSLVLNNVISFYHLCRFSRFNLSQQPITLGLMKAIKLNVNKKAK